MASFGSMTYEACGLFHNSFGTNRFIRPLNDPARGVFLPWYVRLAPNTVSEPTQSRSRRPDGSYLLNKRSFNYGLHGGH
jgi:hypothetical protein